MFDSQLGNNSPSASYLRNAQQAQSADGNTFIGYNSAIVNTAIDNVIIGNLPKPDRIVKTIIINPEIEEYSFLPQFMDDMKSFLP